MRNVSPYLQILEEQIGFLTPFMVIIFFIIGYNYEIIDFKICILNTYSLQLLLQLFKIFFISFFFFLLATELLQIGFVDTELQIGFVDVTQSLPTFSVKIYALLMYFLSNTWKQLVFQTLWLL